MTKTEKFEQVEITKTAELRDWLLTHHGQAESVWLVTFKKHCGERYVATGEVLDELIAFGWIDGIRRKLDVDRTMQLIAPRRTETWAQSYKERAARLEREGRMEAAGRAAIARSKALGLWNALAEVDALVVPDDLAAALAAQPPADAHFAATPPSYRRNVMRWIKLAKTAPTRAKRIDKTVALARRNERVRQM